MTRIEKTIEVDAPIEQCYKVWTDFENFPRFMKNIESIRQKGAPNVWQWKVKGPGGNTMTWDMQVDGMKHRNNIISWHTIRNADVVHSGAITLKGRDKNRTCVSLVVEFVPPPGQESQWAGGDNQYPAQTAMETLNRFKQLVESGVAAVGRSGAATKSTGQQRGGTIAPEDIPYSI